MRYRYKLKLTIVILFTGLYPLLAQPVTESRTLEKSFPVSGQMTLEVINKYGKVHVSHSLTDTIYIRIEIEAKASSDKKLRKMIDGVTFELTSTNYFIFAESNFNKGPTNFLESIRSITNNLISSDSKLEINYFVSVPPVIAVKIDNRYGDIFIESLPCDFTIKHSNGAIKAERLSGDNNFDLSFSDLTIDALYKSKIDASYSELNLAYGEDIDLTSSSSRIQIGSIENLRTDSKRDKFFINRITHLTGESYFSDYNIDTLEIDMNMTSKYGNIDVDHISNLFELVLLESSYTDIRIKTGEELQFNMDVKLSNCPVGYPADWNIEEKVIDEEKSEYIHTAIIGSGKANAQILLNMTRGRLTIR